MAIDKCEERIDAVLPYVTNAQIGDSTNEEFLASLGVSNYDVCIVAIGEDFQSSLETTSLLKEAKAKLVVSRAERDVQAKFLRRNGADEVVYPEVDTAEKLAVRYNATNIFDFVPLTEEYSIYELPVMSAWAGHTLMELNIRRKYQINIIAVKNGTNLVANLSADYRFRPDDHIIVIGRSDDVFRVAAKT